MQTIRDRRLELGITQIELARRVGASRQYLGRVESRQSLPNVMLAQRVAIELRTPVSYLWPLPADKSANEAA